jgi:hypothetical protein
VPKFGKIVKKKLSTTIIVGFLEPKNISVKKLADEKEPQNSINFLK